MAASTRNGQLDRSAVTAALRMVNGLFAPGTPVPAAQLLTSVAQLLGAAGSAMVMTRIDPRRPVLLLVDALAYEGRKNDVGRFDESVTHDAAWDQEPTARRLRQRVFRHPRKAFTFSLLKLLAQTPSFSGGGSIEILTSAKDWQADRCSVLPLDGGSLTSLLFVYRDSSSPKPFSRAESRLLAMVHEVLHNRVIELRAGRLREELPRSVRHTFALMLSGKTEKEIARLTHRSPNTVHDHVKRIYLHFDVGSRAQLLARFVDVDRLNGHRL